MKILSVSQLKELDAFTIQQQNITSIALMERAAKLCYSWIKAKYKKKNHFSVFCGNGNNGGDGLVIARLLKEKGFQVNCYLMAFKENYSEDNFIQQEKLKRAGVKVEKIYSLYQIETLQFENSIVIDALFGIGTNRKITGEMATLIHQINQTKNQEIVAIDVPSGMFCDELNQQDDAIIQADYTLTFHAPKWSFFLPEAGNNTGKIIVLDIGLDKKAAEKSNENIYYLERKIMQLLLKKRKIFSHKGTYGHACLIAGSYGKMGAAILMAKGTTVAGTGLVSVLLPKVGIDILQITVPTAMCEPNGVQQIEDKIEINPNFTYGIGPGLGTAIATQNTVSEFIKIIQQPLVIDADALNILSMNKNLLHELPENSVLTPHILEFERLTKKTVNSKERIQLLKDFAKKYRVFIVLKDARTIIATPKGDLFFSLMGNPGMATGGSGDVLAGMITGFLAQKMEVEKAVQLAVFLHGFAGNIAAKKVGEASMDALSIVKYAGKAIRKLEER